MLNEVLNEARTMPGGWYLLVHIDMCYANLHFATKEDAKRFKKFASDYVSDSGVGNSYSGCFDIWNESPKWRLWKPKHVRETIEQERVDDMYCMVVYARVAVQDREVSLAQAPSVVNSRRGMEFIFNGWPVPRLRPQVGDMFRAIEEMRDLAEVHEGRVLKDLGGEFEVSDAMDEMHVHKGEKPLTAKIARIRADKVMKIPDYLSRYKNVKKD